MARINFFAVHRTWEDWLGMALGLLVVLSPVLAGSGGNDAVMVNSGLVGVLILSLGALELVDLRRWEEGLEMLLGFWLMASPFVLGYADGGPLMTAHLLLGALIAAVSIYELWQDWQLPDRDLAQHGH